MTLRGFASALDEEEKVRPLPGTHAHLRWAEEEKKKQVEAKAREAELVDNSLLITNETVPETRTVPENRTVLKNRTVPDNRTVLKNRTVENSRTVLKNRTDIDASGYVTIEKNYMRFDMDIFTAIKGTTLAEKSVYLELVRRSYGCLPAKNLCSCTSSDIMYYTGITAKESITQAIKSLEAKCLIQRLFKASNRTEKSLFRVYLPCELSGTSSRTVLTITKGGPNDNSPKL